MVLAVLKRKPREARALRVLEERLGSGQRRAGPKTAGEVLRQSCARRRIRPPPCAALTGSAPTRAYGSSFAWRQRRRREVAPAVPCLSYGEMLPAPGGDHPGRTLAGTVQAQIRRNGDLTVGRSRRHSCHQRRTGASLRPIPYPVVVCRSPRSCAAARKASWARASKPEQSRAQKKLRLSSPQPRCHHVRSGHAQSPEFFEACQRYHRASPRNIRPDAAAVRLGEALAVEGAEALLTCGQRCGHQSRLHDEANQPAPAASGEGGAGTECIAGLDG